MNILKGRLDDANKYLFRKAPIIDSINAENYPNFNFNFDNLLASVNNVSEEDKEFINKVINDTVNENLYTVRSDSSEHSDLLLNNSINLQDDKPANIVNNIENQTNNIAENNSNEENKINTDSNNNNNDNNEITKEKKYKIETKENDAVVLPKDYSTNDEDEKNLIAFMNRTDGKELNEIDTKDENLKLYSKIDDDGTLSTLKITKIAQPLELVKKCILDDETRKKWDTNKKGKETILETKTEENLTTSKRYLFVKSPMFLVSDREMVFIRRIWEPYNKEITKKNILIQNKSCEDERYPENEAPVRVMIYDSGYYLEEIDENTTKFVEVGSINPKLPATMLKMMSGKAVSENKKNLQKISEVCDKLKSEN